MKRGDQISLGLIPCRKCGERHGETIMEINPIRVSWASDLGNGHVYMPIDERKYIQQQRDFINKLLKEIRHLKSRCFKLKPKTKRGK